MARDFNQTRNTNAKLVNATIDKYGASYPAQSPWRADGFNKVFVETEGANPTQKDFLEGNSSVYVYAIGSNIGSLLPYSLASFTNIKELYLFSPTMVNIGAIDNDYLTYLTDSDLKVYVPSSQLQNYINAYGGTGKHLENRFDEITDDYPLTISGSGDLTSKELTNQLMNKYESVDRTNCTKLIIQGFTNVDSIIWGYDFSEILPNLNNNVWVNGVKFDLTTLTISGSGTLTSEIVESSIASITSDKLSGVSKLVVPSTWTSFNYNLFNTGINIQEYMPNCINIEIGYWNLGGGNYDATRFPAFNDNFTGEIKINEMIAGSSAIPNYYMNNNNCSKYDINFTNFDRCMQLIGGLNADRTTTMTLHIKISSLVDGSRATFDLGKYTRKNFYRRIEIDKEYLATDFLFTGYQNVSWAQLSNQCKIIIEKDDVMLTTNNNSVNYNNPKAIIVPSNLLIDYLTDTNWSVRANKLVGFLDYTDTIPTFTGYTDQWYEDEDTTIPISTQDFVSGNRYYVKLTAI